MGIKIFVIGRQTYQTSHNSSTCQKKVFFIRREREIFHPLSVSLMWVRGDFKIPADKNSAAHLITSTVKLCSNITSGSSCGSFNYGQLYYKHFSKDLSAWINGRRWTSKWLADFWRLASGVRLGNTNSNAHSNNEWRPYMFEIYILLSATTCFILFTCLKRYINVNIDDLRWSWTCLAVINALSNSRRQMHNVDQELDQARG